MKTNTVMTEFLDACISSGKFVETSFELPQEVILKIEDVLNRYNDSTAKTKIKKILKDRLHGATD